ncbi:MAG: hypothetical protein K5858_01520 [Lachnospiraceae bacterium]|jgi:multicomponent Na+:H+ antiporter subunit B|nr:hypothetical protein [Lachnospiraceae bacterium]
MSKKREDYEKSFWYKISSFVNDGKSFATKEIKEEKHIVEEDKSINIVPMSPWDTEEIERTGLYDSYKHWSFEGILKRAQKFYGVFSVLVCVLIIGILLFSISKLPRFGNAQNPVNNEVSRRYIEKGIEETGAVNIVTGMILDYRAFDTLGESHVLFTACIVVFILLRLDTKDQKTLEEAEADDRNFEPKNDTILQKVTRLLVPPVFIFGIYVILNGHLSPGGGFSGGAIIGAGLILYLNAFGFKKTGKFFTLRLHKIISIIALGFYSLSKSYSFFTGANHLESFIPKGTPGNILSSGLILPLNIAVGMVVACTMYGFYVMFRKGGYK